MEQNNGKVFIAPKLNRVRVFMDKETGEIVRQDNVSENPQPNKPEVDETQQ